jgi:Flp pilus assembly protein TadG
LRRIRDFWRDQGGNAAMIFGLAAIPLIALAGGAVDFAYRAKLRNELQSAADTAALAAARLVQDGEMNRDEEPEEIRARARQQAQQMLDAALANLSEAATRVVDISILDSSISISANLDMETSFLGLIGIRTLPARALAEVNLPDPTLVEIAMVLDYSGSMRDADKYIRMRSAAREFIDKVGKDRGDRSKIGIVPFSEFVYANVNSADIRDHPGPYGSENACLRNRDYPYSATNDSPYGAVPASKWPQATVAACDPYVVGDLRAQDLTDDFEELSEDLADMEPVGLTNIALGMELGWHMLSPDRPFDTARPYSDTDVEKILILLTDGVQTVPALGPSGETSTLAADDVTAELCTGAKNAGVRIFSIAYDIDDARVQDLLSGCASGETAYFDARAVADISDVFESIYAQILESAWLSR